MFGRVIAPIAQAGQAPSAGGPTDVSIATGADLPGQYDNAFIIYRVGTAVNAFETGSNFSSNHVNADVPRSDFMSDRDRSIAFGVYARATTSGGALSYTWTLTEVSAFPTGSQTADAENTAQNLSLVGVPSPPSGSPDTSTGIGPYVLFSSGPSLTDSGRYEIDLDVTDSNGTTSATTVSCLLEFA